MPHARNHNYAVINKNTKLDQDTNMCGYKLARAGFVYIFSYKYEFKNIIIRKW